MARSACLPDDTTLEALLSRAGSARKPAARQPRASAIRTSGAPTSGARAFSPPPSRSDPPPPSRTRRPSSPELGLSALEDTLASCESLEERFSAVGAWLSRRAGASRVFVFDDEGLSLTKDATDDAYGAAAGDLGSSLRSTQAFLPQLEESSARLKMTSGERVELVWCDTPAGRFGVGAVSTEPLAPSWTALVPSALKRALET